MEGVSFDSEFQDIIESDLEVTAYDDNHVMTVDKQKPDKVVAKHGSSQSDAEYKIHSTSFLELDDDQFELDKIEEVAYRLVQSVLHAAAENIISERNVAEDIAANATAATMTENESGLEFMEAMNSSPTLESDKNDAEIHATDYVNDSAPDNSFIEGIFSSSSQSVGEEKDEKVDSTDLLLENIEEDKFTASGVTTTNASENSDLSDESSEQVKHDQPGNDEKLIELENTPLIRIQSTSHEEVGPVNSTFDRYQVEEEKDRDMVKCTAIDDQSSQLRSLSENITYRPAFTQRNIEATKWFGQSTAEDKIWMKPLGKVDANAELERRKLIKAMTRRHNPDLVPKWQPPKEVDWRDSLHQRQRESLKKYEERQRQKRERPNYCASASDTQIVKDDTPSEQLQSPPPTTNTYSHFKSSERSIVRESVVRSRDAINQWEMTLHEKNRREQLERKRLSLGKNKSEGEVSVSHSAEPPLPQQNVASSSSHSTTLTSDNVERDSVDISQVRNRWREMERESKMTLQPTFTIKNGTCTKIKSNSFAVGSLFESKRLAEMNDVTVDAHERGGIDREIRDADDSEKEWKYNSSRSAEHAFVNTDNSSDLSATTNHDAFTNIHSASSSTRKKIENDISADASRDEIWKEIHSPEPIRENIVLHNTTSPTRHKSIDGNRTIDRSEPVKSLQSYQSPLQSSNSNQSTTIDKSPTNHRALSSSASDEYAINRKVEGILKELASTDPSQRNLVLLKTLESLGSNLMFASDEKKEKKYDVDSVPHTRKEEWESISLMTPPRNMPVDVSPSKIQQDEFAYKLRSSSLTSSVVSPRGWESKNRQVTSVLPSFSQRPTHEMELNSATDIGAIKSPTKLPETKPHNDTFRSPSKFPEFTSGTSRVNEREFEKKATSNVNSPSKFPEFITVTSHASERELEKKTISEINHSYQPQVAEESRSKKRGLTETNERPKSVHKTIPYESPYIEVTEADFQKTTVTNQLQSPVSLKRYEKQSTTKTQPIKDEHELNNCKTGPRFEISASKSSLAEVLEKEMNDAVEREEQWKIQQLDNSAQAKKAAKEKKPQRNAAHRQSTGAKFTVRPLVSYDTRPYDSDR